MNQQFPNNPQRPSQSPGNPQYPQNPYGQQYGGYYNRPQVPQPPAPSFGNRQPQYTPPAPPAPPSQPPQNPQTPQPAQTPQPTQQPPAEQPPKQKKKTDLGELLSKIFVGTLTAFVLVYMGWLFSPTIRNAMVFWPTHTPTPVTPTPTLPATATITPLPTNTPTPAPTATPGPISDYFIRDGNTLDPAVPNAPDGVVILSAQKSAEVDPPFDSIYWTSSKQIVQDLGRMNSLYDSEWFATLNPGSIQYFMDRPLKEGLYEIYVMDTYYSSGGNLDFSVKLGTSPLSSLTGRQTVSFMTSQYDPRQSMDTWRSLGIFYVMDSRDLLSISTSWRSRDEYSYVSADRVMIVPRRMTDLGLLNRIPSNGIKYVMDDTEAAIGNAGNSLYKEDEKTAWDDAYQLILNPKNKVTIEYKSKEPWPIGYYTLFAWFPESKGGLEASVEVFTDGEVLENDHGEAKAVFTVPEGGAWTQLGTYTTGRYYERPVKFSVKITIDEGQSGEYPIDAIAFLQQGFIN